MSATWRKSSHSCANGNCVEVADLPDGVIAVRDSKDPDGGMLTVSREAWTAFTAAIRDGNLGNIG